MEKTNHPWLNQLVTYTYIFDVFIARLFRLTMTTCRFYNLKF